MKELKLSAQVMIVGKKSWKKKIISGGNSSIIYKTKRIPHKNISDFYKKGKVLLDLMRDNQTGLSFRIFEAMALKKKIY